jgi:hypothetical protein
MLTTSASVGLATCQMFQISQTSIDGSAIQVALASALLRA